MRILWLKLGGLWPLNTGGRLRSFHILSELSKRHCVTLVTTHSPEDDPAGLRAALPPATRIVSLPFVGAKRGSARFARTLVQSWFTPLPVDVVKFRVPAVFEEVRRLFAARAVDLCIVDFLNAMSNLPRSRSVPAVLFEHNVEHLIWKRLSEVESRWWRRMLIELEWRKLRRYEGRACERANLTISVSEADRELLARYAPAAKICAIPTGVDTAYFSPNGTRGTASGLVFVGSMDWFPNEDAVLHFLEAILPHVRREVPEVSFTAVGRNPSPRLRTAAAQAGVRLTGTVDDVRPYVAESAVYVVPLRVGGGTRLKIFEALAMAKAVVSTSVGAEGLPLRSGEHFLRADTPIEFASAVVSLLRDEESRRSLGHAGRRLVEQRYSWIEVAREFEARCLEAVTSHES